MEPSAEATRRHEAAPPLALIERLDRHGQVLQATWVWRWPWRIGRSFEADLVLSDPHLAPLHAELDLVDGAVRLKMGDTVNGALVGRDELMTGESRVLKPGQSWRMGDHHWRVRLPTETVAPEVPLHRHGALPLSASEAPALPAWPTVLALLAVMMLGQLFERWLDHNPGTSLNAYLTAAVGAIGVTLSWALIWALGNKLFQGRLDFRAHLRLALVYSLVLMAVDAVLPWLAYAMDWPMLSRMADAATAGVVCALIWAHLVWIMPAHRHGLMAGIAALYVAGVGLNLWVQHQRTGQFFSERYAATLPPPAWRLVGTQPVSVLIDEAREMKEDLDRQAQADSRDDEADLLAGE